MGRKSLHVLPQIFYLTLCTALFLLRMSNTGSSLVLLLKHIFSFVDKSVLLLQIKTWFRYVAERSFEI